MLDCGRQVNQCIECTPNNFFEWGRELTAIVPRLLSQPKLPFSRFRPKTNIRPIPIPDRGNPGLARWEDIHFRPRRHEHQSFGLCDAGAEITQPTATLSVDRAAIDYRFECGLAVAVSPSSKSPRSSGRQVVTPLLTRRSLTCTASRLLYGEWWGSGYARPRLSYFDRPNSW